jgi:hypothetical protein
MSRDLLLAAFDAPTRHLPDFGTARVLGTCRVEAYRAERYRTLGPAAQIAHGAGVSDAVRMAHAPRDAHQAEGVIPSLRPWQFGKG